MSAANVLFDAPGPKARRRHAILSVVGLLVVVAIGYVVVLEDAGRPAAAGQPVEAVRH